jgi:pimeloyl-ACP methyl ester carboxylesterase
MARGHRGRRVGAFAGLLGGGFSAAAWIAYRRDVRRARERVSVGSRVVETPRGPIEYGSVGEGPAVLVVHGAGGGFDQGLEIAGPLVRSGFRLIAISRFGYLKTPLPADASPAAQADAYACLLDVLGIQRVAVVGASAGAPSSMQFALRHPERTTVLALVVPAAYPFLLEQQPGGAVPEKTPAAARFLVGAALQSDLLFWVARRVARKALVRRILGIRSSVLRMANAGERERIDRVLDHIQPLSGRRMGLLNDLSIVRCLPRYELERIAVPTLVLGVTDCLYGTYASARYCAEHIPRARFVSYASGGHLWVGHQREVMAEISSFLETAAERNREGDRHGGK